MSTRRVLNMVPECGPQMRPAKADNFGAKGSNAVEPILSDGFAGKVPLLNPNLLPFRIHFDGRGAPSNAF